MAKQVQHKQHQPVEVPVAQPQLSVIERATQARKDYETLRQTAIDDLLTQRQVIDETLVQFGYDVRLAQAARTPRAARVPGATGDKPCRVCGQTGHDARRHRFEQARAAAVTGQPQEPV